MKTYLVINFTVPRPNLYPHTLTFTLTTEPPINRVFQAESEGVRVKKKKSFFILEIDE